MVDLPRGTDVRRWALTDWTPTKGRLYPLKGPSEGSPSELG